MNSNELKEKLSHYYNLREELRSTNIDEAVDAKLEEMRAEIEAKIKSEIKSDIDKCTHYIEILDILVKEQCDKEDAAECQCEEYTSEEINEEVENNAITSQEEN